MSDPTVCPTPGVHVHSVHNPFGQHVSNVLVNTGRRLPVICADRFLAGRLAELLERHGLTDVPLTDLVPFAPPDPAARVDHPGAPR